MVSFFVEDSRRALAGIEPETTPGETRMPGFQMEE